MEESGATVDPTVASAALARSPDGFAAIDAELRLTAWNHAAERLLGWRADEVLGRPDPTIPTAERDHTDAVTLQLMDSPGPTRAQVVERVRKDGTVVALSLRGVFPVPSPDGGPGLGVFFSVATDDEVRQSQRTQLSRDLVSAITEEDVLVTVTEAIRTLTGAVDAVVLSRCASQQHLHGHRALGGLQEDAEQLELDLEDPTPWRAAVRGRVAAGQLTVAGEALPALFVPMGPDGEAWVLALRFDGPIATDREVVSIAQGIAAEAWVGLQRASLVAELEGKVEILEATAAVASSAGLDLDETLSDVARHAAVALSCERSGIYLRGPDGELTLASLYATDLDTDTVEGARTAQEALERRDLVIVQDAASCTFLDGPWHHEEGAVAVMVLPLTVAGRDIGSLVVAHTLAHPRGFTNLCQQVGTAVAQQAALAIEHARLYRTEQDSVRRLTELDQLKRDYVQGITHDLKTPLTGLLGFVVTLKRLGDETSEADRARYLDVVERQAVRLIAMVEDLLTTARADDEVVAPLRRDRIDVARFVDEVLTSYEPERRDRITVSVDVDQPAVVEGDPQQLWRVLVNVLDNALKYTLGAVRVEIRGDDDRVELDVVDEGPGVDQADRQQVFQRFGVGAAGRVAGATGIGLFTSRSIARGHGGDLHLVDRAEGEGARFRLSLPAEAGDRSARTVSPATSDVT